MIPRCLLALSFCLLTSLGLRAAEPLRVFIRAGEKTHGPADNGLHDHPQFLKKWVPLLNERGAVATGGMNFPTEDELNKTDVLVLFAQDGATVTLGQRPYVERFVARGGGIVVIHDAVCGHNPEWFKNIVGGAWEYGKAKFFEGDMNVYFTPPAREHPVTKGMSNFDLNDEIYYDLHLAPEAVPLAVCWTPEGKTAAQTKPELQIYATAPQMWSYEKDNHRAFVSLPGHRYSTFERPNYRALLLRAIAWTGHRENTDELVTKDELASLAYPEGGPTAPDKSAAKFDLHPDFDISLVAAEPLINKPMNVNWDAQGRLWVVETPEYPEGTKYGGIGTMTAITTGDKPAMHGVEKTGFTGRDKISILTDTNNDGLMDKKEVFADGLNLATSFVFHKNGVIVTQAPEVLYFTDTDGDGKADKREVLYTGLGNGDTHAVINNARWGHDGWIYATHGYSRGMVKSADGSKSFGNMAEGVVRFKPDGSAFEQYTSKSSNTWGLDITGSGEIFWTQPTCGDMLMQSLLSEAILSKGKVGKTPGYNIVIKSPKSEPLLTWKEQAYVQIDLVGSFTAAAGCAIYEGGAWPKEWNKSYFCTEPTINIVHHQALTPNGVTYDAKKVRPGEFLRSKDLWFRPVENRVGPDGALYIVDMYNQAAIHNDTRGPKHGPHNAAVRPDRDHYFGRIWRIQHKQAQKLEPVNLAKADAATLEKALQNPNRQVQDSARRLLAEGENAATISKVTPVVALSKLAPPELLVALSRLAENGAKPEQIKEVMDVFASLKDPWSQSAAVVILNAAPLDTLKASLAAADVTAYLPLVEGLSEKIAATPADTDSALNALAEAPATADAIKIALLQKLGKSQAPGAKAALTKLLKSENPGVTLAAFVVATRSGVEEAALADATKALQTALTSEATDPQRRVNAAEALLGLSKADPATLAAIGKMLASGLSVDLKKELIAALGSQNDAAAAESLLGLFTTLTPDVQTSAMSELMKKPERALAVIAALESKKMDYAGFGPGNYFQLKSHPDKAVAAKALAVEKSLRGAEAQAKDALLAKLTPEVTKPGDAAKGKLLFEANCATCHQYGDKGVQVGPNLTGMGAHGASTLLVHVIDPNREVDPTYTGWIAQKKDGQFFMGIITRQNNKSIFLRNQANETELNRAEMTLTNTGRSFMPEGFEALGAEVLRDILTYLTAADSRYRFTDFAGAATADSRLGLYISKDPEGGMLRFAKFGIQQAEGVPFNILDPAKSAGGNNLIQLKGGPAKSYSATQPQEVTLNVGYPATRIHFLSGVAGWGFPYGAEKEKVLQATVVYQGGKTESFDFTNGEEFADYIREVDVPGSKAVKNVVTGGQQIRYFNREIKGREPIEKIVLKSPGGGVAPTIAAITLETADGPHAPVNPVGVQPLGASGTAKTASPESAKAYTPTNPNGLKVQLFGGGSSHDFEKWFNKADVAILEKAGFNAAYSGQPAEWAATLEDAKVLVMSANQAIADLGLRKKIFDFGDSGRGMVLLHAALWQNWNDWSPWNQKIVGGFSKSHDALGEFEVTLTDAGKKHPALKDIPEKFTIRDELYHFAPAVGDPLPEGTSPIEVLATATSNVTKKVHPILWTVSGNKNRVFACSLGHDGAAHELPVFQKILTQAVEWVSGK